MSIICSICGKKQSGFIVDYPLSNNYREQRICANCENATKNVLRLSEINNDEYELAMEYFTNLLYNNVPSNDAQTVLLELKKVCESNVSLLIEKQRIEHIKEQEKEHIIVALEEKYNDFLMTTGYEFEGLNIIKYNKVICEQVVLGTGFLSEFSAGFADFFGVESNRFANKLDECREVATRKLIDKAINVRANAIIGIDFDYTMFNRNLIGVIVNGTAVTVNKQLS